MPPPFRRPEDQRPPLEVYQRRTDGRLPHVQQVAHDTGLVDHHQRVLTASGGVRGVQRPDLNNPASH